MTSYRFESWNDWISVTIGKANIVVEDDGRISHLTHGRAFRTTTSAEAYVDARPRMRRALNAWIAARREARDNWLHTTPHFRFDCDGGCLAMRVNGRMTLYANCGSDGNHPVYIIIADNNQQIPPFFTPKGFSLGNVDILEPLDYDCAGGQPLATYTDVADMEVYQHTCGYQMLIRLQLKEGGK